LLRSILHSPRRLSSPTHLPSSPIQGYLLVEIQAYFQRFPKDRLAFKVLVTWILVLELFYYAVRFAVRPLLRLQTSGRAKKKSRRLNGLFLLQGAYDAINEVIHGRPVLSMPASLSLMSISISTPSFPFSPSQSPLTNFIPFTATLVEATTEGWFVFRLWRVTKRWWMRGISITLWVRFCFSSLSLFPDADRPSRRRSRRRRTSSGLVSQHRKAGRALLANRSSR
jgi:hypothetical protein